MIRLLLTLVLVLLFCVPNALTQTVPTEGLRENTPRVHAFINVTIIPAPGREIKNGTLVIRDGVIEDLGAGVKPPPDARVHRLEGATIYPGLIDPYSDYGIPKSEEGRDRPSSPSSRETAKGATHWNEKAKGDFDITNELAVSEKSAQKLRSQGFTLVHVVPQKGIFRGQSAIVALADKPAREVVMMSRAATIVSFYEEGGFFSGYPHSLMGIIAFIRQTWYDADWYTKAWSSFNRNPGQTRPETNTTLAALGDAVRGRQPVFMEANDDLSFLRASRLGKEFSLRLIVRGSGEEYRRLSAVKATGVPVIVPLNFPETPEVGTPEEALNATLEALRHWDAAPENAGRLAKAGVPIALTAAELKDPGTFLNQVRKAVSRGLSQEDALAAMTINPARWLGMDRLTGSLEKGKSANLLIATGNLFDEKTKVREVWIDGEQFEVTVPPLNDARGQWDIVSAADTTFKGTLLLKGEAEKPAGSMTWRNKELKLASPAYENGRLSFSLQTDSVGWEGMTIMSGTVSDSAISGVGNRPDGSAFVWSAVRTGAHQQEPDTAKPKKIEMASFSEIFPPREYGRSRQPDQPEYILIKNATVWTQGPQGRLENADLLVRRGKITEVGKGIREPRGAVVVDATGKHVTPGMIDCHSHTAAASINEGGQAVTCETRIEDVLDSDNIWIYRQLAGGTTTVNILHGSANPIGGQNAVVKWRWGLLPEQLLIDDAPPGVKFALGENVKRSNFTPPPGTPTRYPATRMGVEQIIRDRFKGAQEYEQAWKKWESDKSTIPPRRDLELDAIVEMLKGKRLIHAHSYRQDEILMLLRIAEEFGIRIATFQHVLEGYKVAEALAKHGAGASTFSDWWAYKIEAWDAIPANGPIMHQQGVVVSYNSDNAQLASRMNWEAAKALEFGLSEEEALNFVTMNPARQLGIAKRVGSLEAGKDADFAIWSGNPLSTLTKCEQTWVDGRKYFDLEEDRTMREEISRQRAVLIQKILASKKEGASPGSGTSRGPRRPNELDHTSCIEEVVYEN